MSNNLFSVFKLSKTITLNNRILMAPLTRCFSDENLVATKQIADYYERRAGVGLIISEATIIDPLGQGYPNTPGIYNKEQIKGWKLTTKAVHDKGGKIFCQLWHCGIVDVWHTLAILNNNLWHHLLNLGMGRYQEPKIQNMKCQDLFLLKKLKN